MVTVFVPTMLQPMTGGVKRVDVPARNVRQLVDQLDQLYPGMRDRLLEDGQIRRNLAVSIDGEIARLGLMERLSENSEVHFVPAIGGGNSSRIR